MISKALERWLKKRNIVIKPNFVKLLEKVNKRAYKEYTPNEAKKLLKEINKRLFVILNRANSKRKKKSTSPVTAMYIYKIQDIIELQNLDNINSLKIICQHDVFSSITGMQNWKGMIKEEDFKKIKKLCTEDWKLDRELLSSITMMQAWRGMIKEEERN